MRPILLLLAALAGFACIAAGYRRAVPWPDDQALWTKWEYFVDHKDEFDAVWIGSSLVLRDIDAPEIDAALAEAGVELTSYNFGVGGMGTYEQDFLLHRVLALEPARLKHVFLEGGPVGLGTHPRHIFQNPGDTNTMRSTFWHDRDRTRKVLGQIPRLSIGTVAKLDLATTHARLFGRNLANYGLGPEIKRGLAGPPTPGPMYTEEHGFRPYPEPHDAKFDDPAAFADVVAGIAEVHGRELELGEIHTAVHAEQYAAVEARGASLVYVNLPASIGTPERPFLHRAGVIPTLFDFNRPDEFPELFAYEHRWDKDHLNRDGVALLTPLLAERVLAHVRTAARD